MDRGGYTCGKDIDLSEDVHPNFVQMGDRVRIRTGAVLFGSCKYPLIIGSDVYVNARCVFHGAAAQLRIGNRVTFAVNVCIHTDSGPNTSPFLQKFFPIQTGSVVIGDDVWIGDHVVILPGVTIHGPSVVGAHTLVKKDVEPFTVVAGSDQRIVSRIKT